MKTIAQFLVRSNLLVSASLAALVFQTQIIFDCLHFPTVLFAFSSTLLIYNFQRIYKNKTRNANQQLSKWMEKNKIFILLITSISAIITFYLAFSLRLESMILLGLPFLISVFYVVRFIKRKKKSLSLRELPYLKIFLISFIWSIVAVPFPLVESSPDWSFLNQQFFIFFIEKFLFVLAITIPFDIRDLEFDPLELKTLPQVLGVQKSIFIGIILILISASLAYLQFQNGLINVSILKFLLISYAFYAILLSLSKIQKSDLYYGGILDSVFLIQSLGIYLITIYS